MKYTAVTLVVKTEVHEGKSSDCQIRSLSSAASEGSGGAFGPPTPALVTSNKLAIKNSF